VFTGCDDPDEESMSSVLRCSEEGEEEADVVWCDSYA
jgi:hypothetical protein